MNRKPYTVWIDHDKGSILMKVFAMDAEHASQLAQRAENCPASAIRFVSPYNPKRQRP